MSEPSKYLGIDFGLKRIGIAITDESKTYSFARDYILNDGKHFDKLLKLIKEENVSKLIIGYPVNFKSEKTEITLSVEKFSETLKNKLINISKSNPEIIFYDERLTSGIAQHNIFASGLSNKKKKEKGLVDSVSAQIILQDYIDSLKNK